MAANIMANLRGWMTYKPRLWPTVAAEQRDQTAELANRTALILEPVLEGKTLEAETIRRVGIAISNNQKISRLMEKAGAKTEVPLI